MEYSQKDREFVIQTMADFLNKYVFEEKAQTIVHGQAPEEPLLLPGPIKPSKAEALEAKTVKVLDQLFLRGLNDIVPIRVCTNDLETPDLSRAFIVKILHYLQSKKVIELSGSRGRGWLVKLKIPSNEVYSHFS